MNKNQIISLIIVVVIVLVGGFYLFNKQVTNKEPTQLKKVKITMAFIPTSEFLSVYAAVNNGYYKEEGLDVTIEHQPNGSFAAAKQVASGASEFAYTGGDGVVIGRSQGLPIVAIYQIDHENIFGIMTKKDSNITTPQGMIGKSISNAGPGCTADIAVKGILKNSGVDLSKVNFVYNGGDCLKSFLSGATDAAPAFPLFEEIAKTVSPINTMYAKDFGANLPGGTIATSEDMIKNNSDIVAKFVKATDKGLKYAIANPEESVNAYIKNFNPDIAEADKALELVQWKRMISEVIKPNSYKLGQIGVEQYTTANNVLKDIEMIENKIDISKAYTTQFIPK